MPIIPIASARLELADGTVVKLDDPARLHLTETVTYTARPDKVVRYLTLIATVDPQRGIRS